MAETKLQMNWASVGFTPSAGTLTSITKVRNCTFDPGGQLISHSADGDKYPTTIVNAMNTPKASVTSGAIATLQGFTPGTIGTFTATHSDAKLATLGGIVYTLINAVVENTPSQGEHANFGEGTMTMQAFSSDGTTSPLSFTRV